MKTNPIRYSSAVGEVWLMMTLKVKYCHNIFDIQPIREFAKAVLEQALHQYGVRYKSIGFDSNHVHINLDLGLYSRPALAKKLKGFTAPRILKEFWWLKSRLFRGGGFWNPATDSRTGDMDFYEHYVANQKYGCAQQQKLSNYA